MRRGLAVSKLDSEEADNLSIGGQLSLPGSPFSLKALNLRRGVVGCNGMFVLLASLLFSLRGCLQTRAALHAENLALRHQLLLLQRVHQNRRLRLRFCGRPRLGLALQS